MQFLSKTVDLVPISLIRATLDVPVLFIPRPGTLCMSCHVNYISHGVLFRQMSKLKDNGRRQDKQFTGPYYCQHCERQQ